MGSHSGTRANGDVSETAGRESTYMDKLGKSMEKSLYIDKSEEEEDCTDEEGGVHVIGNLRVDEFKSSGEGMSRLVAFPSPGDLPPSGGSSDEEYEELGVQTKINHSFVFSESDDEGPVYVCEIYLPDPSTIVPAVRGSREKQGLMPKERRVSWSEEVYDPVPKEVSYTVKSKQKKLPKSEKKTKKEKLKGSKASKSSSTKDKKQITKQTRKNNGGSRRGHKCLDADYW